MRAKKAALLILPTLSTIFASGTELSVSAPVAISQGVDSNGRAAFPQPQPREHAERYAEFFGTMVELPEGLLHSIYGPILSLFQPSQQNSWHVYGVRDPNLAHFLGLAKAYDEYRTLWARYTALHPDYLKMLDDNGNDSRDPGKPQQEVSLVGVDPQSRFNIYRTYVPLQRDALERAISTNDAITAALAGLHSAGYFRVGLGEARKILASVCMFYPRSDDAKKGDELELWWYNATLERHYYRVDDFFIASAIFPVISGEDFDILACHGDELVRLIERHGSSLDGFFKHAGQYLRALKPERTADFIAGIPERQTAAVQQLARYFSGQIEELLQRSNAPRRDHLVKNMRCFLVNFCSLLADVVLEAYRKAQNSTGKAVDRAMLLAHQHRALKDTVIKQLAEYSDASLTAMKIPTFEFFVDFLVASDESPVGDILFGLSIGMPLSESERYLLNRACLLRAFLREDSSIKGMHEMAKLNLLLNRSLDHAQRPRDSPVPVLAQIGFDLLHAMHQGKTVAMPTKTAITLPDDKSLKAILEDLELHKAIPVETLKLAFHSFDLEKPLPAPLALTEEMLTKIAQIDLTKWTEAVKEDQVYWTMRGELIAAVLLSTPDEAVDEETTLQKEDPFQAMQRIFEAVAVKKDVAVEEIQADPKTAVTEGQDKAIDKEEEEEESELEEDAELVQRQAEGFDPEEASELLNELYATEVAHDSEHWSDVAVEAIGRDAGPQIAPALVNLDSSQAPVDNPLAATEEQE